MSKPSTPLSGRQTPFSGSLEQAGITVGSPWLATPEEAAAIEAEHRKRIEAGEAAIDRALGSQWACRCCGTPNSAAFSRDSLCYDCRVVIARLRTERAMVDQIGGRSRRELAEAYLDQTQQAS